MTTIDVNGTDVTVIKIEDNDSISLTGMVQNTENGSVLIGNWLRNRNTIEFLGIWEHMYNPDFNSIEFDGIKNEAGLNRFALSVKQWSERVNSRGLIAKAGRYGGTYAHKDIAFEFASWISPQFKLYLIKEFQRLKDEEQKQLGWDIRRNLTKINYRIHTSAISEHLVPEELPKGKTAVIYATEADVLNMALFGMTAKEWRSLHPDNSGNIRDFADISQLVCLANLETLNAHFIEQGIPQRERLILLNKTAISQMKILIADTSVRRLKPQ
ncbi:MAG TPA: KilA-N domain-containing protein [Methanocorpusculum sp.]|nr:KilA-N domain-containing protein [Methanocorpusculum sp.]HJK81159.1 KilA-N domain-containing protein [Methanocorpusculum sp.]